MQRYASTILSVCKRAHSGGGDDDDVREAEAGQRTAGGEFVRTGTACLGSLIKLTYMYCSLAVGS